MATVLPPTVAATTSTPPAASTMRRAVSTPVGYRAGSLIVGLALVAVVVAASTTSAALDARAGRVRDRTGPVLVATQQLYSSLAEADAAAAAVQLSGRTEDREQRRFYEQALERSTQQVERVASLVGSDQADRIHRSQCVNDLFAKPLAEVLLVGGWAVIGKRQH